MRIRALALGSRGDIQPIPGGAQAFARSAGASMVALRRCLVELSKGVVHDLERPAPVLWETDLK
jgi:hypothetical protein